MDYISLVSKTLAALTVAAQFMSAELLIAFAFKRRDFLAFVLAFAKRNALRGALAVSLTAMLGSLFYSEAAGYTPCALCWYQRVFMYPLPFIFGIALLRGESGIFRYTLPLTGIGLLIAAYHYLLQVGVFTKTACGTVGFSAACSENFFMHFSYITIPLMSFSAFLLLTLLALVVRRRSS